MGSLMKSLFVLLTFGLSSAYAHLPLQADLETTEVNSTGDAADDTTVWIHPTKPEKSLIVGTDKKWGLIAYDLNGKKTSEAKLGNINNIDSRQDFLVNGQKIQILAGSERSKEVIDFYTIDASNKISIITSLKLKFEPYGVCIGHTPGTSDLQIVIPTKSGLVDHWSLKNNPATKLSFEFKHVASYTFSSVTEGCVIDDKTGTLYVAEEGKGLWKLEFTNPSARILIDKVGSSGNLVSDVEGIAIYDRPDVDPLLLVSSQGNNSFHVYKLATNQHVGSFTLVDGTVDGVNDTDGIDIMSMPINAKFPMGFFIAQDGSNKTTSGGSQKQNFKIVNFQKILKSFGL